MTQQLLVSRVETMRRLSPFVADDTYEDCIKASLSAVPPAAGMRLYEDTWLTVHVPITEASRFVLGAPFTFTLEAE